MECFCTYESESNMNRSRIQIHFRKVRDKNLATRYVAPETISKKDQGSVGLKIVTLTSSKKNNYACFSLLAI